ncbi:50S ribosomal protein L9 [bacterium]|nr:50S ribosomal protein L9 [bacterium]
MQILLLKDIEKVGREGDIVTVTDGYARNYLIPRKKAIIAGKGAVDIQKNLQRRRVVRAEVEFSECKELAERIANLSCTISAKVGEEEKLFGSVTTADVAEALRKEGVEIDKKKIILDSPIKSLGIYSVNIRLHPEVKATLKLWVVKE